MMIQNAENTSIFVVVVVVQVQIELRGIYMFPLPSSNEENGAKERVSVCVYVNKKKSNI